MNATKFISVLLAFLIFVSILFVGGGISIALSLVAISIASFASVPFILGMLVIIFLTAYGLKVQLEEIIHKYNNN